MPQVMRRPREFSIRMFVGGVLYVEGIIVLVLGSTLMFGYWPPVDTPDESRNPVSLVGMWICGVAVTYMLTVGMVLFVYNMFRPGVEEPVHPIRARAYKYRQMRVSPKSYYLFDDPADEEDAEEAFLARQMI